MTGVKEPKQGGSPRATPRYAPADELRSRASAHEDEIAERLMDELATTALDRAPIEGPIAAVAAAERSTTVAMPPRPVLPRWLAAVCALTFLGGSLAGAWFVWGAS